MTSQKNYPIITKLGIVNGTTQNYSDKSSEKVLIKRQPAVFRKFQVYNFFNLTE